MDLKDDTSPTLERSVQIRSGSVTLEGDLIVPERATGLVLFAHGS